MSTKGIIFSAPMVRALLAGTKTQTRRFIQPTQKDPAPGHMLVCVGPRFGGTGYWFIPPYDTGDRLYVREAYYQFGHWAPVQGRSTKGGRQKWAFVPDSPEIRFDAPAEVRKGRHSADPATPAWYARLARFMPKTASRMWLDVTEVRVQRLQDISEEDAIAEGCDNRRPDPADDVLTIRPTNGARLNYADLWNTLHTEPDQRWEDNPWIVAVSFVVHRGNVDEVAQ